jgi:hypothetical protein
MEASKGDNLGVGNFPVKILARIQLAGLNPLAEANWFTLLFSSVVSRMFTCTSLLSLSFALGLAILFQHRTQWFKEQASCSVAETWLAPYQAHL